MLWLVLQGHLLLQLVTHTHTDGVGQPVRIGHQQVEFNSKTELQSGRPASYQHDCFNRPFTLGGVELAVS